MQNSGRQLQKRGSILMEPDFSEVKKLETKFKTSSAIYNSLMKKQEVPSQDQIKVVQPGNSKKNAQNYVLEARKEKEKQQEEMKQEIMFLPKTVAPIRNEKTIGMIQNLSDKRRNKHLLYLEEVEVILDSLHNIKDGCLSVFETEVDNEIEQIKTDYVQYYEQFNDGMLLSLDNQINDQLKEFNDKQNTKSIEIIDNGKKKMRTNEEERWRQIEGLYVRVATQMNNIGYKLDFEITVYIQQELKHIQQQLDAKRQTIEDKYKSYEESMLQMNSLYQAEMNKTVERYKQVQFEETVLLFRTDIKDDQYRNPRENQEILQQLDSQLLRFHEQRSKLIDIIQTVDIEITGKTLIEKLQEKQKEQGEKITEYLDTVLKSLKERQKTARIAGEERLQVLKDKLEYLQIQPEDKQKAEEDMLQMLDDQTNQQESQLKEVVRWLEEFENRGDQVVTGLIGLLSCIAKYQDQLVRSQKKDKLQLELDKAQFIDEDEETVERILSEVETGKKALGESKDHEQLEQNLLLVNQKVDILETHYRSYHSQNTTLIEAYPGIIEQRYLLLATQSALILGLVDIKEKEQIEKEFTNNTIEQAKTILNEQLAAEEEERQKTKDKKKIDPKKAAAEQEERLNKLVSEIGIQQVLVIQKQGIDKYCQKQSIDELCTALAKGQYNTVLFDQEEIQQEEDIQLDNNLDIQVFYGQSNNVTDVEGRQVFINNCYYSQQQVSTIISSMRERTLLSISIQEKEKAKQTESTNETFLDSSLLKLEERLKRHYPLKGQIETEIYQQRGAIVVQHKRRYERTIRSVLEKLDSQSKEFNTCLESLLQVNQKYDSEVQQQLTVMTSCVSLTGLKGCLNLVRELGTIYTENTSQAHKTLSSLITDGLDSLSKGSHEFILTIQNEGYSHQEIIWYQQLMSEVQHKINHQKDKRNEQQKEIILFMEQEYRRIDELFMEQYEITSEEFSAKNGIGKKYGRPKRLGQERLRLEMNKCETAQECLDNMVQVIYSLYDIFQTYQSDSSLQTIPSESLLKVTAILKTYNNNLKVETDYSLLVRQVIMILRCCMHKYQSHLDCLAQNTFTSLPVTRVNYDLNRYDTLLNEQDQDSQRIQQELEILGPLYFSLQKENKNFMEFISEIEKTVVAEAQKIYNSSPALVKFLTGTDKIPDYLRIYLTQLKQNSNNFRIQSSRILRNTVSQINEESFIQMLDYMLIDYTSIKNQRQFTQQRTQYEQRFEQQLSHNTTVKAKHELCLRPNMKNPCNREELQALKEKEQERQNTFQEQFLLFDNDYQKFVTDYAESFLKQLLNNFEFLLIFYDGIILYEDFNKLPGDEENNKKPENLKKIMIKKQLGKLTDTSSERSLSKFWDGVDFSLFKTKDLSVQYALSSPLVDEGKTAKDKKKDPKAADPALQTQGVQIEGQTKQIKSYKTFRQKAAFSARNSSYATFLALFQAGLNQFNSKITYMEEQENKFKFYWEKTILELKED